MRRAWLPSISVALWLVLFLGLTLSNWRWVLVNADGDPCLHRRIGEWMIENHAILQHEQFSHTRFNAPVISKEWLSEVIFAGLSLAFGWNGVVLLAAALIATTFWLLHRQLLAAGTDALLATGLVLLGAFAAMTHWLARPHLATHLLVVAYSWVLHDFYNGRCSARRLFVVLPVLMLLWTNLHGAFFTGFILIGIFFLGALWEGRRDQARVLAGVVGVCLAASLINPNTWRLHAQIIHFLQTPELSGLTNEFRSPNFHSAGARGFLLELLAVSLMLFIIRPVLRPTEILTLGVWGYFALHSARNVPLFGLVATPILAQHFQTFLQNVSAPHWYRRRNARATEVQRSTGGYTTVVLVIVALLLIVARSRLTDGRQLLETEILTNRYPTAAVAFIQQNPSAVSGEMFNEYGWGGYLMWAMPERKVFIDGRNDFYGKELVDEFQKVDLAKPGWDMVLNKYRVGWTILPLNHRLNALLALDGGWKTNYADEVAVVFTRR